MLEKMMNENENVAVKSKGQFPNLGGRPKNAFSGVNQIKRAEELAMKNIARAAQQGNLEASIAVVQYMSNK